MTEFETNVIKLLTPSCDVEHPEVSIVVPSLNESRNIREFIDWSREGLETLDVPGEILIVDSSTDDTPDIAVDAGARVLKVPKRGLGRAYVDAIPFIRGQFVIMGDADCTYDFRQLKPFYDALCHGADFVMGSRFRGSIERGAMPPHHRYFGTPATTWLLNRIFGCSFSDIHCGMRAIRLDWLKKMDLTSQSWDYASEMVIKATQCQLSVTEVPVHFLKDRNGRVSHHRREGWLSPFRAAWINIRMMFVYGCSWFLIKPGLFMACSGLLLVVSTAAGPIDIGRITLSLHWQILGSVVTTLGIGSCLLGYNARSILNRGGKSRSPEMALFAYGRSLTISAIGLVCGVGLALPLVFTYLSNGLLLFVGDQWRGHLAVLGLTLVSMSFQLFTQTLVFHASRSRLRYQETCQ